MVEHVKNCINKVSLQIEKFIKSLKHDKTFNPNFLTLRDLGYFLNFLTKDMTHDTYEVEVEYKFKFTKRSSM